MVEVVPAVRRLVPDLLSGPQPSVACVCTTSPKYLVFDRNPSQPACVVEFADVARVSRVQQILTTLGGQMADAVAASLCCTRWQDDTYVHIQSGLPGIPWFRVADTLATRSDWERFIDRAVALMIRLHEATRRVSEWKQVVRPGAELRRQTAWSLRHSTPLSAAVLHRIADLTTVLENAGPFDACHQHGDFSVNNLITSGDTMAIIDFDEFGGTNVPLHDAFGLALSIRLSQAERCPLSLQECIARCVEPARQDEHVDERSVPGLLMHHLLWRINQCYGVERRAPLRSILLRWVELLASSPAAFFDR